VKKALKTALKLAHKPSHNICLNYVPYAQADQARDIQKSPIFAPTAGARSSISPKLCMLIYYRERRDNSRRCQSFFDPTHSFSCRGENADFWSLTHWVNLIPSGCHGNLPVKTPDMTMGDVRRSFWPTKKEKKYFIRQITYNNGQLKYTTFGGLPYDHGWCSKVNVVCKLFLRLWNAVTYCAYDVVTDSQFWNTNNLQVR